MRTEVGSFSLFRERKKREKSRVDDQVRCVFLRYSVPQRLFAPWTTWIRKVFVHPGTRWFAIV